MGLNHILSVDYQDLANILLRAGFLRLSGQVYQHFEATTGQVTQMDFSIVRFNNGLGDAETQT